MKIVCDNCGVVIDRDTIVEGQVVEEYKNIYGTRCSECGCFIKPTHKPSFQQDWEGDREMLRLQMLEKLKKKLRRK